MPPRHSGQFVLGVEAEEGVEGNLNYFGGGLGCKKPTSWEHPPLRTRAARPVKVLQQGLAAYLNVAIVDGRIMCFPEVG